MLLFLRSFAVMLFVTMLVAFEVACYSNNLPSDASYAEGGPVLVLFTSEYCSPCHKAQKLLIDAMKSGELAGITVLLYDIHANKELADQYEVKVTPTILVGRGGRTVLRTTSMPEAIQAAKGLRDDK